MALFAMAVPILPGKTDQWLKFLDELRTKRREEFVASRQRLGVRERTFLQRTPMGDLVVVTLEGDDPQSAFAKFAQADDDFTRWFKAQVQEAHGLDLSQPPPGPLPELVVDSAG